MVGTVSSTQSLFSGQPTSGQHRPAGAGADAHQGHGLVTSMPSDSYRETGAAAEAATLYAFT